MFVSRARYMALVEKYSVSCAELNHARSKFWDLVDKWNDLVARVNACGGKQFLDRGRVHEEKRFSKDEIMMMIKLCHPDKHGGSAEAGRMTARLLELRGK